MSDRQRILARLEAGLSVSPVDFQAPTCDGLKPILCVAARIRELREEGHEIITLRKHGNGVATYILLQSSRAATDGVLESDAAPTGTPGTAVPSVDAVQQAPAYAVAPPAAVASLPLLRDPAGGLLDSTLFDGSPFNRSTSHWEAT